MISRLRRKPKPRTSKPTPHVSLTDAAAEAMQVAARIHFTVPGTPVPVARARVSVRKFKGADGQERTVARAHTPARTRTYENHVRLHALDAVNRCRSWRKDAPAYRVQIRIYRDVVRGDLDNIWKGVADSMNGVAYVDDRQVCDADVVLRTDRENPRVEVTVEMLEAA